MVFGNLLSQRIESNWWRTDGIRVDKLPKEATAERCFMVMCPLGRSWYRGLWDKKTRERNNVQNLIETNVFWEPCAHGSLDGRRREGSDSFTTEGSQWSADEPGVTSAVRLHDATNALLSMKHDVDKQAANQMALTDADKVFF